MDKRIVVAIAFSLAAFSTPASAQGIGALEAPGPWHEGVDSESKALAKELFEKAVALQKQWRLSDAVKIYRQALKHWEHPDIYFYLGRSLEKMGDILAAYENLNQAERWGPHSLEVDERPLARELRQRLEKQVAFVEIHCDEPGAEVVLDGKRLFTAPGSQEAVVIPGEHAIIAKKDGYFTVGKWVTVLAGNRAKVAVQMSQDSGATVVRRWRPWVPLAVLGTGMVSTWVGMGLTNRAEHRYRDINDKISKTCERFCPPESRSSGLVRARRHERLGNAALAVGVGAMAAGLVMLVINHPRIERAVQPEGAEIEIVPVVSADGAGLSVTIGFH